jgi:hypothetical protein
MKKIDFIYFDAGGGHRAAATALKAVIESEQRPWQVRMVHLRDILDPIDIFRKVTRIDLQEIYNLQLRKGWTLGSGIGLRVMQQVIRLYHRSQVRLLREFWRRDAPDLVVSLIPNFNKALYEAFSAAAPGRPLVTILTDLADYPPHFWIEAQPQSFVCGTARAEQQARSYGHPAHRIFRTSGMILNPSFYEPLEIDRAAERARFGLAPDRPTALVLFGGYGSGVMRTILDKLDASGLDLQLVFVCGRNEELRQKLQAQPVRLRKLVEGFTSRIPYYMRLADFFIGKPGPGSISEAVHMGLPVITIRDAWTLPQERYNSEWLRENKLGLVVSSFSRIDQAVAEMLSQNRLTAFRESAAALHNRAVFEIPGILDTMLTAN